MKLGPTFYELALFFLSHMTQYKSVSLLQKHAMEKHGKSEFMNG